ncbi:uncharacterized protein ACA1_028530 [Acanthamoeba castellanii str. Neff]|uniref:Uncharacterized protein n=1 Tax=Acanthamoeba castellanii (strain ATCC 30010 / Neff) TaxID=1257118 RepID=L8GID7_ACACF|nr:uncharacterized protein ACA1_028530 [Acanthamoeba castellanii str. Neff]ELR12518.1 hypothetical protein ACA1_028530 [Acanthamoeba castellanii str. Neff]
MRAALVKRSTSRLHPLTRGPCASSLRWFGTAKKETAKATAAHASTPLEASNLPDPRAFAQEKAFWATQEPLKQKRLQAKEKGEACLPFSHHCPILSPHFVFLEGSGGAGKKDLLWRLNKMGHEVVFHPYLTFLLDSQYPYTPTRDHDILQVRWGNKIINALENIASLSKTGKAYKSNLVFVHRSPISSYHYARDRNPDEAALYLSLMRQITTERLGERLMVPPEKEKALRRELGESTDLDVIQREIDAYERLLLTPPSTEREHHGIGATVILKTYGVEMNWVWEDLKKTSSPPAH